MNTCQDEHLLNIDQYEDQTNRILMMVQPVQHRYFLECQWDIHRIWMDGLVSQAECWLFYGKFMEF